MADTDDDQTVALEPDQHVQGDDDTEAAGERRAARVRKHADEHAAAAVGLTAEEEAARAEEERAERLEEELTEARAEELEEARENEDIDLAARDQQELEELRQRRELRAAAETTEAIRLSEASRELRRDGDAKTRQAMSDWSHGHHELDEAAARPDDPGAAGLAADGRRYQRAAVREDRSAEADYQRADEYDAEARERRSAAQEQPPAIEAVRRRPSEPPEARKYVDKKVKKLRKVQDRSTEPDLGLG